MPAEHVQVQNHVNEPASCRNSGFFCGLDAAACVPILLCSFVFLFVSVSILHLSCWCETSAHAFVSVCERNRQGSPMGSMLSLRKADYGAYQGVRNPPRRHYTYSQPSTHLYGSDCKALRLVLSPAIWIQWIAFPTELDVKSDAYCAKFCRLI